MSGTPRLAPAIVNDYEIGWDRALPQLRARMHASVFHQSTAGVTGVFGKTLSTPTGLYSLRGNIGSSDANGIELGVTGVFTSNWRWGLNYRLEAVADHFAPEAAGGKGLIDFQHVTPKNLVKANLGWSLGKWEADLYVLYQSPTLGLSSGPTSSVLTPVAGYVSVDGRVAYKLTDGATLSLSGQDFAQARQRQTSGPDVQRRVIAGVSVDF